MEAYTDPLSRGVKRFTLVKKKLTPQAQRRASVIRQIAIIAFYTPLIARNGICAVVWDGQPENEEAYATTSTGTFAAGFLQMQQSRDDGYNP